MVKDRADPLKDNDEMVIANAKGMADFRKIYFSPVFTTVKDMGDFHVEHRNY